MNYISTCQNNLTIVAPSNMNPQESVNRNITVNQYTIPVIIHTDQLSNSGTVKSPTTQHFESLNSYDTENFNSYNKDTELLTRKARNLIKKRRKRHNKNLKQLNEQFSSIQYNNKIVFISDESDEDSNIKKLNESGVNEVEKLSGDQDTENDDIIYIPPPPIEIINVDEDPQTEPSLEVQTTKECMKKSPKKPMEHTVYQPKERNDLLHTPESTSNDFLESATAENTDTQFNFGLHGSDFNSNLEFAKPTTPVDDCETESSCSTNDQNRDFNNSAKSIVFDEVEFPREDIFGDKNLDNFSSFITPKRNSKHGECSSTNSNKDINVDTLDDSDDNTSSLESDYDTTNNKNNGNSNKNLPVLSPMVSLKVLHQGNTPKTKKKQVEVPEEISTSSKKSAHKRKSDKRANLEGQVKNKLCKKKMKDGNTSQDISNVSDNNKVTKESHQFDQRKKGKKNHNTKNKSQSGEWCIFS